jgi:hypothetical protein
VARVRLGGRLPGVDRHRRRRCGGERRSPPAATGRGRPPAVAPGSEHSPLTAGDLPLVVDRVVRELDRRLVAVRERRGWAP